MIHDSVHEHATKAEALLDEATPTMHLGNAQLLVAEAQVQATLAVAAGLSQLAAATHVAGRGRR